MNVKLQKATEGDCEALFRWRNDPLTRESSLNSGVIQYEKHCEWFTAVLTDPKKLIYIAVNEKGQKIGNVRFDTRSKKVLEISVIIAPEQRGKGYGSRIISLACAENLGKLIIARVKKGNAASVKAFKKAGFFDILDWQHREYGDVLLLGKVIR